MNSILHKILINPQNLIIIHLALGILFAIVPQLFIPFYYFLFVISISWIFFNKKSEKHLDLIVTLFFYLMMYESVSRLLALDPLIPWELGKYLTIFFVVYLFIKQKIQANILIVFAIILLASMLIKGVTWKGFFFNATIFFALLLSQECLKNIKFTKTQLLRSFKTLLLPLYVFIGASFNQIQDFQNRQYDLGSNSVLDKIPSNQVATYMGLAFFLSIIPFFVVKGLNRKWTSFAAGVFLLVGLLSFSRGGIITAVIGLLVISLGNIVSGRLNYLIYLLLFLVISTVIVFYINDVTDGNLFLRYQGETKGTIVGSKEKTIDTYTTGRVSIFLGDWETFKNNWLFGVEIGQSRHYRKETESQQSHVELSRVLSEHGILGLIAFIVIIRNGFSITRNNFESKQFKYLMFALWCIGFITTWHGATRTILPFIFMSLPMISISSESKRNGQN